MNKLAILAGALALSAPAMFADTMTAFLDSLGPSPLLDSGVYVSPYSGHVGASSNESLDGAALPLYCDDEPDHATVGTSWSVYVTRADQADAAHDSTRFGKFNAQGDTADGTHGTGSPAVPVGVALYEEVAWLFTQDMGLASSDTNNRDAIQEAVWLLTDKVEPITAHSTVGGANDNAWLNLAGKHYADGTSGTSGGLTYTAANYTDWYIITDTAAVDKAAGTAGKQEFLAYSATTVVTTHSATPEPATFVLFGAGLLAAGFIGRRKRAQQ